MPGVWGEVGLLTFCRVERSLFGLQPHRAQRPDEPYCPLDHPKVSVSQLFYCEFVSDDLLSGAWLVVPSYLIYVFGSEILQGLEIAAGLPYKKEQ
jgi:hypothetical protein